jgi:hypothetical protein
VTCFIVVMCRLVGAQTGQSCCAGFMQHAAAR